MFLAILSAKTLKPFNEKKDNNENYFHKLFE